MAIKVFDPRSLSMASILDDKLKNYYVDDTTGNYVIETIAEYLTRVTFEHRFPDSYVAILLPKTGTTPSFSYATTEDFDAGLDSFDCKQYQFKGGIADGDFVEVLSSAVESGLGMDFVTGAKVDMGLPSTITSKTENALTEHSHTHKLGSVDIASVISPDPNYVNYGALYNWYAIIDSRNITSSDDWVIPTREQWAELAIYNDSSFNPYAPDYEQIAGNSGKLKEIGTVHWNSPNTGASDSYGFKAVGGGYRLVGGGFSALNTDGRYFVYSETEYQHVVLYYNNEDFYVWNIYMSGANQAESIRLLYTGLGTPTTYTGNDGKVYPVVQIGSQYWLASNLNETKFRDGSWISGYDGGVYTPISNEDWVTRGIAGESLMCYYNDKEYLGGGEKPLSELLISDHDKLNKLSWTESGHTGTANKIAGFDNDGNAIYLDPSEGSTDEKVKYDAADPTAGYIVDKFVAGAGISIAEGTGANENKLVVTNSNPTPQVGDNTYIGLDDTSDTTYTGKDKYVPVVNEATSELDLVESIELTGATGTFTTADSKTVTVTNGIITSIV